MASVAICWETDDAFKTAKKQGNAIPGCSLNPKLPFDLSSRLQLLLVFGSVSSQELDLGGSSEGDDGHDSQDEEGQLPAIDEGDDDADADVGKVLRQRRQTSTGSLVRDINIQSASLILRGNNPKARHRLVGSPPELEPRLWPVWSSALQRCFSGCQTSRDPVATKTSNFHMSFQFFFNQICFDYNGNQARQSGFVFFLLSRLNFLFYFVFL